MIASIEVISISTSLNSYHLVCAYMWWEHLRSVLLTNFKYTILLTIVTILCIISPETVYDIFRTYSSYYWKFVFFDQHLTTLPTSQRGRIDRPPLRKNSNNFCRYFLLQEVEENSPLLQMWSDHSDSLYSI